MGKSSLFPLNFFLKKLISSKSA
uniref:Uncharacterized protein n=1 Tax=Vitis vinifera TaxID=29760 RepID=F6HTJ9_VITVI